MKAPTPILCYVTDRKSLPPPKAGSAADSDAFAALLAHMKRAARAGADWIQLREKDLEGRPLFELTMKAMQVDGPCRILVNDRLDVAWAAQAGGVHFGENGLPAEGVAHWRNQAGRSDFLIGASCHSLERAVEMGAAGADYIFFGPVFATPSKAAFGPPQGLQKLREVCRALAIPVLAIGGITGRNAATCLEAGAAGIAAIRLFQEAEDPAGWLRQLRG
jgi:thiamine-phosphate pyrophosphorylase